MHGAYILAILFFIVYANIKASEADKYALLVSQTRLELENQIELTNSREQEAEKMAAEAKAAENRTIKALEELEECRNK